MRTRGERAKLAFVNHLSLEPPRDGRPLRGSSLSIWHFELARRLAADFDVVVYSPRPGAAAVEEEQCDGAAFVSLPTRLDGRIQGALRRLRRLRQLAGARSDPSRPLFASRFFHADYARRVGADLVGRRCDLACVTNFSQFPAAFRARDPRLRTMLHMQCEWLTQLDAGLIAPRLEACDAIGGCSRFVADRVARAFPSHAGKCFALHNGVDLARFHPEPRADSADGSSGAEILFVGRVSPEKGVHVLVEAFRTVVERVPAARLRLIGGRSPAPPEYAVLLDREPLVRELARFYAGGSGAYEAHLRRALSGGLAERVTFLDDSPQEELARAYRRAAVVVFPSVWNEPFGMPLAEAMASGVPVVSTRGGGIPEFVEHGVSGLLVERGDAEALAGALVELLLDPDLRARLGRAGRERVERDLSWDQIARDLAARIVGSLA